MNLRKLMARVGVACLVATGGAARVFRAVDRSGGVVAGARVLCGRSGAGHGHGTFVAGIIGGARFGVAKQIAIVP